MKPTICTASGVEFDLMAPTPDMVRIEDIAHALSNMPRFAGHTREFYSVAQHTVLVADLVAHAGATLGTPRWHQRVAMLHDAAEAYVLDVPTPLKAQLRAYVEIEQRVRAAIFDRFEVYWPHHDLPSAVKSADKLALLIEQRDLMPTVDWWRKAPQPEHPPITPLAPTAAREAFLARWRQLNPES